MEKEGEEALADDVLQGVEKCFECEAKTGLRAVNKSV